MAEYKDITELKKQIADFKKAVHSPNGDYLTGYVCALSATEGIISRLPNADVVPVVRCKDCKHRGTDYCIFHIKGEPADEELLRKLDEDFCSYGEMKET